MITAYEAIQRCISHNCLELVFPILKTQLADKNSELYSSIILLEGTFNNVTRSRNLNQISYQEYLLEIAKINNGIQGFVAEAQKDKLLTGLVNTPDYRNTVTPPPAPTTQYFLWLGAFLLLGGLVWAYLKYGGQEAAKNTPSVSQHQTTDTVTKQGVDSGAKTQADGTGSTHGTNPVAPSPTPIEQKHQKATQPPSPIETDSKKPTVIKPPPPVEEKEKPKIVLTITVNSDLSEQNIYVDGKLVAPLGNSTALFKKIRLKPNASYHIKIGDCEKDLAIEEEDTKLVLTCHQ